MLAWTRLAPRAGLERMQTLVVLCVAPVRLGTCAQEWQPLILSHARTERTHLIGRLTIADFRRQMRS